MRTVFVQLLNLNKKESKILKVVLNGPRGWHSPRHAGRQADLKGKEEFSFDLARDPTLPFGKVKLGPNE